MSGPTMLPWVIPSIALSAGLGSARITTGPARLGEPAPFTKELRAELERLIRESGAKGVAVAFLSLETMRVMRIGSSESYHAGSTMKIAVMIGVFRRAREGHLRMDEPIPIRNEFKSLADGSPFSTEAGSDSDQEIYQRVGGTATVRELVEKMVTLSSNLATNLLIDRVTAACVMQTMHEIGAPGMRVLRGVEDGKAYQKGLNNTTTADALVTILRKLAQRSVLFPADSDAMVAIMERQTHRSGIPAGLPAGIRVANKTGSLEGFEHDAAIVYPPGRRPYILVVLTRGAPYSARAVKLIADISRAVYAFETGNTGSVPAPGT